MNSLRFRAKKLECTNRFARALANWLPRQITVGLTGTLGAGKTYLVQQICRHWGIPPDEVVSPTFTLCNEYGLDRKIYHLDLYRIKDEDDLFEVGATEYFNDQAVVFVEWADRFPDLLPDNRLDIQIEIESQVARTFTLTPGKDCGTSLDLNELQNLFSA